MKKTRIVTKLKLFFLKLAKSQSSTSDIAWGAAIGTFISVFPTFGFGMPLVILLNRFLKFNLIAALALSVVSNPFTSPFFLLMSYHVGAAMTGTTVDYSIDYLKEHAIDIGWILLLGSFVVSGLLSVVVYAVTRISVAKYRDRDD